MVDGGAAHSYVLRHGIAIPRLNTETIGDHHGMYVFTRASP